MNTYFDEDRKRILKHRAIRIVEWFLYALIIGVVMGLIGRAFEWAIEWATETRRANDWLIFCMPAAGLAIVGCYHVTGARHVLGTNRVLLAAQTESEHIHIRMAPLIFISTVLTHLTGGSAGREGAALQLGGSVADFVGRHLKLPLEDNRIITMCGMAAGFSALFGTPLAAAIFAVEVACGAIRYPAVFPSMLASYIARVTALKLGGNAVVYRVDMPELGAGSFVQVLIMGALCGFLAMFMCWTLHTGGELYHRFFRNDYLRIAAAGVIVAAVVMLSGTREYCGAGTEIIQEALAGRAVPWAFAAKLLLTALTLGAGYKGGEIVPALAVGASFGCAAAPLFGMDPAFGAGVAMIANFCGVTNCPLASVFLAYEMFEGEGVILCALACSLSYILSGRGSLYSAQHLEGSKYRLL